MPSGKIAPKGIAFNAGAIRARMLSGLKLPDDLVQAAIDNLRSKINAKETKFFTHQGQVIQKTEVEAHGIQMDAIKEVLKMTELTSRGDDRGGNANRVAVRIDQRTGNITLVVGANAEEELSEEAAEIETYKHETPAIEPVREIIELQTAADDAREGIVTLPSRNKLLLQTIEDLMKDDEGSDAPRSGPRPGVL